MHNSIKEGRGRKHRNWFDSEHQENKIMLTSPVNSQLIDGEEKEMVTDCVFLGLKACSLEIMRFLLLERMAMASLNNILKSRDISLATKVCIINAMRFPVVMYGCVNWIISNVECKRINVFVLWCWRKFGESLG